MYDAIIIGAGMSGLAAGIRLAQFGKRVCILERHHTIGGLNSFYRLRGRNHDVGLHAVTNFTQRRDRRSPLGRVLRQLRLGWDDFALKPQLGSAIAFPHVRLRFDNDIELLLSEIAREFPKQVDNVRALIDKLVDYDDLTQQTYDLSARDVVSQTITDPLLVEMLLCPLMWYGNAREGDMDWGQFCVLFRSVFLEGLARPLAGVRLILKNLVRRYRALGGELKLRSGVAHFATDNGRIAGVVLEDGRHLQARQVVSSAGWPETMRMCQREESSAATSGENKSAAPTKGHKRARGPGRMSFAETISVLDCQPRDIGYDDTMVFFNDSPRLDWRRSEELCDERTGVVCSPNNFRYDDGDGLSEGWMRMTSIANFDAWSALDDASYRREKAQWYDRLTEAAARFVPDFRPHVIDTDMFTPRTIRRFTGRDNGAVYGVPQKRLDGRSHLSNLFICGADQGFVGIVGTLLSGICIANRYLLPA